MKRMIRTRGLMVALAALSLLNSVVSVAGTLAESPLSLKGSVPPNVLFSLSVEYPTAVSSAYRGRYEPASEFVGYFDSNKCYNYDSSSGWFVPTGAATNHACSGEWSGNFLNWASMTGLDEFRYAMSGGNRYRDTSTETVLERSYIDSHGGADLFPNKDYTGSGATPYPSINVVNAWKGVRMTVTGSGTDRISCTSPALAGTFSCALAVVSNGDVVTCNAWTGNGDSASMPYRCTSFGTGLPVGATATAEASTTFSTVPLSDTVSCASPTLASGSFSCSLSLASNSSTGTCNTWVGAGTVENPYYCSSFGGFGTANFSTGSLGATSSFQSTATTTTRVPTSGTNTVTCSFSADGLTATCPLGSGYTATSNTRSGSGTRTFSNFSITPSSATFVTTPAVDTGGGTAVCGTRTCYKNYRFAFSYSTNTVSTKYYVSSYSGTSGMTKHYVPSYSLSFSGSRDYNVRVKVCDSAVGLESNCKAFGSSYKPTGVLQDEGDAMKFGVFSYYNSNDVDNAVMRSKAKYLAPQKYSSSGGTVANTNKEWSEADGTLVADPDPVERTNSYPAGSNPSRSGVINYINKFGRPVDPLPETAPSRYKTYDPVGKLYYETLKYLRGGAATTHLYQNATAANNDDFPIITNWDDPIEFSCQKNYIITLGDKNTHCDKRLPGGAFTSAGAGQCSTRPEADDYGSFAETGVSPTVNVATWTSAIDALDPVNMSGTTGAGSASWYMAGLAYWAAKNDIRQDVAISPKTLGKQKVKTYVIDVEERGELSNNAQYGMAAKYGGADSFDADGRPLDSTQSVTISGTTYNWPKTLLRASDPNKMITSVRSAIADIAAQIGTESALAQSSGDLQTGYGAYIYRSTFNSGGWTGDVQAFHINNQGVVDTTATWEASTKLPGHASRRILTYNDGMQADGSAESLTNSRSGTVFGAASGSDFASNFSSRQRDLLNRDGTGISDGNGMARVNYLRGDGANEGTGLGFRSRSSKLGDMVNSNPLHVGVPIVGLNGNGYNAFADSIKGRKPMVYVGGNDGMLHGYDASVDADDGLATDDAGTELIAYVPSAVYGKLSQLASPSYSHQYYVDGNPVASEACFSECDSGDDPVWKTILVGGLNAGGQGIYALDVTDPSVFSSADPSNLVLWEFTDKDDPNLGYTFSKPVIRKMNNGKWAVVFGNGFNNTASDGAVSTTGYSYLYILLVSGPTGAGNTWQLGTDYFRIELKQPPVGGVAPTLPLSPASGLASVAAVDNDANGTTDFIYGGDRYGNIWKIDVSGEDTDDWKSAFDDGSADENPLPLFVTSDGATTPSAQQITTGLEVSRHPRGGFMILVGTGSYIDVTDPLSPFQTQTYYGLWDKNDEAKTRITSRSSLQKQRVLDSVTTATGDTYYVQSRCEPNYSDDVLTSGNVTDPWCPSGIGTASNLSQQLGWVFDLPNSGERVVSDRPLLDSGVLTFTTLTPSTDPCTGNTVGREYDLNYLSGGAMTTSVFDLNGDGIINSSDYFAITVVSDSGVSTTYTVPASGRLLRGGASDTPVRFSRPKDQRDPESESTATCTDFVPGWGCPSKMRPNETCKKWVQDVVSQEFLDRDDSDLTSAMKCLNAPSGRLVWKQILQ